MTQRSKIWLGAALFVVCLQGAIAFGIPKNAVFHLAFHLTTTGAFIRTAFGDITQTLLVTFAAVVMIGNAFRTKGAARVFWTLMVVGMIFWVSDLALWTWYEVFLHGTVPHFTVGDTFLFLHLVPMVVALGARPEQHVKPLGQPRAWLDFSVLLTYWLYVYALLVMPFEYVTPDLPTYNYNFDMVDKAGHWVLVLGLFFAFVRTRGPWRRIYLLFMVASLSYAVFSDVANLAIDVNSYATGDPFDILLIATMCLFGYAAIEGRYMSSDEFLPAPADSGEVKIQWPAVISMAATLSTPAIGLYLLLLPRNGFSDVLEFRLIVTFAAMVLLVFLVFLKQSLLRGDVVESLTSVSQAFIDLKRVKDQLIQTEKLAAMGRLLAGAAHEINNPLTAILGYSDLIKTDEACDPQARSMAEKIGQQARRTKMLVEDLLKFSQETPTQTSRSDVQVLLNNAVKVANIESTNVSVEMKGVENLPQVMVDSSQILQVFVHLIRNAAEAMRESPVRVLHITARASNSQVHIEFADSGAGVKQPDLVFDPFYTTKSPGKGTGLGLSACYGIVQKHGGSITCHNRPQGGAIFTVTLPTAPQPELQNA